MRPSSGLDWKGLETVDGRVDRKTQGQIGRERNRRDGEEEESGRICRPWKGQKRFGKGRTGRKKCTVRARLEGKRGIRGSERKDRLEI